MKLRSTSRRRVQTQADLTPLIDVVFQLLIFFMLTATFVVQSSIQIEMPESKSAATLEQKDLSITLAFGPGGPDGKGPVYIDQVEVATMEEFSSILAQKVRDRPDIMVLVRTDSRLQTGRLVEVLGIAGSVGITRFGIGARIPEDRP